MGWASRELDLALTWKICACWLVGLRSTPAVISFEFRCGRISFCSIPWWQYLQSHLASKYWPFLGSAVASASQHPTSRKWFLCLEVCIFLSLEFLFARLSIAHLPFICNFSCWCQTSTSRRQTSTGKHRGCSLRG